MKKKIAASVVTLVDPTSQQITLCGKDCEAYIKYQAAMSSSIALIAHAARIVRHILNIKLSCHLLLL